MISSSLERDWTGFELAIVGMAGRFPGALNIETFWDNVKKGRESITFLDNNDKTSSISDSNTKDDPRDLDYVGASSALPDIEYFDAAFFGITPKEAQVTDPQHRVMLECAWEALENAGYCADQYPGQIGVYLSAGPNTYLLNNLCSNPTFLNSVQDLQILLGNEKDYLASRVSYKLDLTGPSITVQSACSSSLVAVHMACRSLLGGECDLALAGGVSIVVPQQSGYRYKEGSILSRDGHCRPFDEAASGTVTGSGVGLVALKRLDDALADGDHIVAIVKGSSTNNDGSKKVSYTAPSVAGQARVIRAAHAAAQVNAETITYVEAHGTATAMGDPIEVAALTQAFRFHSQKMGYCAIGSVKSNIGHLDAAAGIAGLIKVAMALRDRVIPPTLHFKRANPEIDFLNSPFWVNTELRPWDSQSPRRAGVSSFGMGGTNAHVVLEEPPVEEPESLRSWIDRPQILRLSARTQTALETSTRKLCERLNEHPDIDISSVAYTLRVGRKTFDHRLALVCDNAQDAARVLQRRDLTRVTQGIADSHPRSVALMFPGQGTQYVRMAMGLYRHEPGFKKCLYKCAELLRPHLECDLLNILYPEEAEVSNAAKQIDRTRFTQPVLFSIEYALARMWFEWGLKPQAMVGHSIGEYVAACIAGVFTLEDALRIVSLRGRLMEALPRGAMLAVCLPEAAVREILGDELSLAAINRRSLCVVSGPEESVIRLERQLQSRQIAYQRLNTSCAFHSKIIEPALGAFKYELERIPMQSPTIPYLSNVTGTWITEADATSPEYWAMHARETVRFHDNVAELLKSGSWILFEMGPGTLMPSVKEQLDASGRSAALSALPRAETGKEDLVCVARAFAQLWCLGLDLDWQTFANNPRPRRVPLPTYPFERKRYWVDDGDSSDIRKVQIPLLESYGAIPTASEIKDARGIDEDQLDVVSRPCRAEQILLGLWRDALGVEAGLHDNFFALGGDSILSLQISYRAKTAGLAFHPTLMLKYPTVAQLVDALAGAFAVQDSEQEVATPVLLSPMHLPIVDPFPEGNLEPFPLNDMQQAYWIGRSGALELGNVACHAYDELESRTLDLQRLEMALRRLVARHPMLRAVTTADGNQRVLDEVPPYSIPTLDLRGQSEHERTRELDELRERKSHQVLPSDKWPLFDVSATLVEGDLVRLHVGLDILFADAWSVEIFWRELLAFYRDPELELPLLKLSFRDCLLAESNFRATHPNEIARDYWMRRIPSLPAAPVLPLARAARLIESPRFVRRTGKLDALTWESLKARAANAGLTPPMVLCAAFADVIGAWSRTKHFCLNVPVFNRLPVHPQVNEIIGDFTSVVLLEVDHRGADNFETRALRIQNQLWSDLDHLDFSGVKVLRELTKIKGERTAMPVVFTSLLLPGARSTGASTAFGETVFSISQTPQVWLDHQVMESDGELLFNWDAVEELFPRGTLDDMFAAYCSFIACLSKDERVWQETSPENGLLPISQLVKRTEVNATKDRVPEELLHALMSCRASETPFAPALISSGRSFSYAEVARVSRQIAYQLRAIKPSQGSLIAIVMEKGWEQVAAALGVLMAGAAYLPVDAVVPNERLRSLIDYANVDIVLTQPFVGVRLELPKHIFKLSVSDQDQAGVSEYSFDKCQDPHDLAYVIFTSGTTGMPKGVMIEHRAVVNTVLDINRRFGVGPGDRVLALSALSFDLSVYDVFGTLGAGATIVMPDPGQAHDPAHLARVVLDSNVTVWNSVPALMEMFVQYLEDEELSCPRLRLVLLSGDWIPLSLPDRILKRCEGAQVISLGGATEASIWSILYPIQRVEPGWRSIPYGKPMTNQQFYILDEQLQACPDWVTGELYIAGVGLARGYIGDLPGTEARFFDHPKTGERLYRTGDLGRWLPDGNIEFLGREDRQVKVQGYRIELGEVEGALSAHPAVRACFAVADGLPQGRKRLVAYVSCESNATVPTSAELRTFLSQTLPNYMVPSTFVFLDNLPVTSNGKVDRRAFAGRIIASNPQEYIPPRTPNEARLAELWADLLGVERVGVHDSFFELGGDSLLAVKAIGFLRQEYRTEIPLRMIFEAPTVTGFIQAIEGLLSKHQPLSSPCVTRTPRTRPAPLSSGQERLWFFDQLHPGTSTYNVVQALRLTGSFDIEAMRRAFNELIIRHEVLRTSFETIDHQPAQVIAERSEIDLIVSALNVADETRRTAEIQACIEQEARHHFDLARLPLFRVRLLRNSATEHVLILTMHHIISDAWSMAILTEEFSALYRSYCAGSRSPLLEPRLQYADFADWEQRQTQSGLFKSQIDYWLNQLRPPLPNLAIPVSAYTSQEESDNGARHEFRVSPLVAIGLKELCHRQGATLFMGLLAAWQTLLCWYTGQTDILVGTPTANREQPEFNGVVGFFVNTLVMRADFSGNPTFAEILSRVRETAVGALAHQTVPYDKVVEELAITKGRDRLTPLFRVWFVLHNVPTPDWNLPGIQVATLQANSLLAVHDLKLGVEESDAGLCCAVDYRTHVLDSFTVARLATVMDLLLRTITTSPTIRLSDLLVALSQQDKTILEAQEQQERDKIVQTLKSARRQALSINKDREPGGALGY